MFNPPPRSPESSSPSPSQGPQDPATALRLARLVHTMLVGGLILFGGVVIAVSFLSAPAEMPAEEKPFPTVLVIVAGALSTTMVLPALMFGGGLVRQVLTKEGLTLTERAQRYVGGHVFLAAMIEGPGLFWGVIALISHDLILLAGLGFSICVLIANAPRAGEWEDAGFDVRERYEDALSER